MANKKYTIVTLIGMFTLLIIFIYSFTVAPTKAYADNITEAHITTNNTQVNNTTQLTVKAPVSITVYSNEVTESSDTYSYNTNKNVAVNTSGQKPVVNTTTVSSQVPATTTNTVIATQDPQSTASPEATPEPDMISYPPTVAPAYTD